MTGHPSRTYPVQPMEHIHAQDHNAGGFVPVSMRCPDCQQNGTFEAINQGDVHINDGDERFAVGLRRCPNVACRAVIYFALGVGGTDYFVSYPPEVIDFDATDLPEPVLAALEEAIKCHAAECYTAAAIMVRKTLEMLCADREATGET